jgi:hypothetical protein
LKNKKTEVGTEVVGFSGEKKKKKKKKKKTKQKEKKM